MKLQSLQSISATRSSGILHPLLRSFLYLTAYTLTMLALSAAALLPLSEHPVAANSALSGAALAAILILTYLFRRFLDQRSLASLGLSRARALRRTARGLLIGGALISIPIAPQIAAGNMVLGKSALDTTTLVWGTGIFVWLAFSAMSEEVVIRGYLLQNLSAGSTVPLGILGSSSIFALLHLANPNVSLIAVVNIFLAGAFFCLYYLLEGTLWGPFGAHLAWNFAQGYIWGLPVSGITVFEQNSILNLEPQGPTWLTGGAFGPEGGFAITLTLLAASALALLALYRRARASAES